jgi:sucrose synthase
VDKLPDVKTLCTIMSTIFPQEGDFLLRQELITAFTKWGLIKASSTSGEARPAEGSSTPTEGGTGAAHFFRCIQEAFMLGNGVYLFYRPKACGQQYLKLDLQRESLTEIPIGAYLDCKDHYTLKHPAAERPLRIDFSSWEAETRRIGDLRNIGHGSAFLFSHLCTSLPSRWEMWHRFFEQLKIREIEGHSLLLNRNSPETVDDMVKVIENALSFLEKRDDSTPWHAVSGQLKGFGFEAGWGGDVRQVSEYLSLFRRVLRDPDHRHLEEFFSRLPLVSKVAILSPHGWFGQKNVLGKPDTGGQVIYILDQVRELEKTLTRQMGACGLDHVPRITVLTRLIPNAGNTSCNQRLERISGTKNGWILRVPFRRENGDIVDDWTSRFHLWPYLDRYTLEGSAALREELQGNPDLIIGNYSDGNIVASLLAEHFGATLCTISHALEKTKYPRSDLLWEELEDDYHFSIHFMSDLLAMERSDFIITSTYQEIAGTDENIGQYESYGAFTLPDCYQVVSGSDIRNPKYNMNPPGVDEKNYFPYHEQEKRNLDRTYLLKTRILMEDSDGIFGRFNVPEKPLLFAMSRLDRIKNLSGFVESYGMSDELKGLTNLMIAGGTTSPEKSKDTEEKAEIRKIYQLVSDYNLEGKLRWLPSVEKSETGEIYRIIADLKGAFVQPALFEGFGLTVLEAMVSGLPTFGTMYGGPSEIIEDGVSGFLIDPHDNGSLAQTIVRFMHQVADQPETWERVSEAGIRRVRDHFTWPIHCQRLLTMANVYGFWRCTKDRQHKLDRERYWEMLYHFLVKKRSAHARVE